MSVVEQRAPLDFLRARLRLGVVEQEFIDDSTLLRYLTEGYRQACERSLCVHRTGWLLLTGTREYALPADHYRTLLVVDPMFGVLDKLPIRSGYTDGEAGYYRVGSNIGLTHAPATGRVLLLYAATPPAFGGFSDTPDPAFPPECYYLLAHYVRWQAFRRGGGAGKIVQARWEKDQYDRGVQRLRHRARQVMSVGPQRIRVPADRRVVRLPRDVDARR